MGRVVILFQANTEAVEQLALAVAVGAVEAGGSIRLRRLAGPDAPELGHRSYGRLGAEDLAWADVVMVGLEDAVPDAVELGPLLALLGETELSAKRGWTFGPNGADAAPMEAQVKVEQALRAAGVGFVSPEVPPGAGDPIARMKAYGRALGAG